MTGEPPTTTRRGDGCIERLSLEEVYEEQTGHGSGKEQISCVEANPTSTTRIPSCLPAVCLLCLLAR